MKYINHIIWDMDGVMFKYDTAFVDTCYNAYGDTALALLKDVDKQSIIAEAKKCYEETRSPVQIFFDKYGLDKATFWQKYNDVIDLSALPSAALLAEKMRRTNTTHSILTIANEPWARRITKHLELDGIFSADNIVTQEKTNDVHKSQSPEPFRIALSHAGKNAAETIMVEDTQKNLKHAKDLGLTTVWVHPRKNEEQEKYVDYVFDRPSEFLDYFIKERA